MDEPREPTAQLSVHVDFDKLRAKLGNAVDRCVRLVSIGFRCSQQPTDEEVRMPGSGLLVSFSGAPAWSAGEARDHYTAWLFATGLRDVLEAFGTFLDECYDIASCTRLMRKHKEHGLLLGQDLLDHQADTLRYRRLGVEKKIQKLKKWFSMLPADVQASVLSINRARNIIARYQGIVPETYLDGHGLFRITWRRLAMVAMGAQQREIQLRERLNAGEGLGLLAVSESREFHQGDRVHLEPIEFSGVCWTVFAAGDAVREALEKEWSQI